MLAVPLADRDDELLGLLVLERLVPQPMSASEVEHVLETCRRLVPQLHAALAFSRAAPRLGGRRARAARARDARRRRSGPVGARASRSTSRSRASGRGTTSLPQVLRGVRAELTRTIGDIRTSIADLRSSPRPERGLGAALSSHVQALGSTGDLAVTTSLRESPFRLPAHVESVLLRLALDLVSDTRTSHGVTALVGRAGHAPAARRVADGAHREAGRGRPTKDWSRPSGRWGAIWS